jgi:polyphosphate kinase 2
MGKADKDDYETALLAGQRALVAWQQSAIKSGERTVIVFEGRDSAGKDGTIKRIVEHLSIRSTRVAALPKPTDRDRTQWYFQRYVAHLPAAGEIVLFNRSWYNRGGVEPVMGFCTPAEHKSFLNEAPVFESMLVASGIKLIKIWLDITKAEQAERLHDRRTDPLKALKVSPLDKVAQENFDDYTAARDEMLMRTHTATTPWVCVRADKKKKARIAVIRYLLSHVSEDSVGPPDPDVLFGFEAEALTDGRLAR